MTVFQWLRAREIFPFGVHSLDQPDLPIPTPFLEDFLSINGTGDPVESLVRTRRVTSHFDVKPLIALALCSKTRRSTSFVPIGSAMAVADERADEYVMERKRRP
jgi:hypothetical protein